MKRITKIILVLSVAIPVALGFIFFQMRKFAEGVQEDAKRKKEFKEIKLHDSARLIFKKVE
jgi:hypothetical protein